MIEKYGEWIITALWKTNSQKCRLGLIDTILFNDHGIPILWLFTSKTGDVVKKRDINHINIMDRFSRIVKDDKWYAIGHQIDGSFVLYDKIEFNKLIKSLPHSTSGLIALQPFVHSKGRKFTILHNLFKTTAEKSRIISHTHKTSHIDDKIEKEMEEKSTYRIIPDKNLQTKFTASNIIKIIDSITGVIIHQIEENQSVRINELHIDYMIDEVGQIWVFWANQINFQKISHKKNKTSCFTKDTIESSSHHEATTEKMIERANMVFDPTLIDSKNSFRKQNTNKLVSILPNESEKIKFNFKCSGDYCTCTLNPPISLNTSESNSMSIAKRFFNTDEIKLFDSNQLDALTQEPRNHLNKKLSNYFTITYKSIALAKNEKRGMEKDLELNSIKPKKKKMEKFMENTISKSVKSNWGKQMGEIDGGASNYYRQVKVCSNCYAIYSMLDTARDIIYTQQLRLIENDQNQSRDIWRKEVQERVTKKEKILRRKKSDIISSSVTIPEETLITQENVTSSSLRNDFSTPLQIAFDDESIGIDKKENSNMKYDDHLPSIEMISTKDTKSVNPQDRPRPWKKKYEYTKLSKKISKKGIENSDTYAGLDSYLRGNSRRRTKRQLNEGKLFPSVPNSSSHSDEISKNKKINVLVIEDDDAVHQVQEILDPYLFKVDRINDGILAVEKLKKEYDFFDIVLCGREIPSISGIEVTKLIRLYETQKAIAKGQSVIPERLKIIAYTGLTSSDDMCLYMEAGMDGCISKPPEYHSLLRTISAALPYFNIKTDVEESVSNDIRKTKPRPKPIKSKIKKLGKQTNGAVQPLPSRALPYSSTSYGNFQMDADTVFPYVVLKNTSSFAASSLDAGCEITFFNLVIVHDFFDTFERLQIFFQPLLKRYPGVEILCWNYPGQAFTEWRRDVLLNNEYLANCLSALLHHVGEDGTKEFRTSPFLLLGFGNGGSIATCYASGFPSPQLRSLILLNAFCFIDPNLSSILHDCMNIFSCSPASRPDVPVYFYSRFLFSGNFLSETTVPLALNLYTAVHNPITLEGRIQLCLGALSHADMRQGLSSVNVPVITLSSSEDKLVLPLHTHAIVAARGGQFGSIHEVLKSRTKTCVIWLKTGHEVFLEAKKAMIELFEQFITGYHETRQISSNVTLGSVISKTKKKVNDKMSKKRVNGLKRVNGVSSGTKCFEDTFIDHVVNTLAPPQPITPEEDELNKIEDSANDWNDFKNKAKKTSQKVFQGNNGEKSKKLSKISKVHSKQKNKSKNLSSLQYQIDPDSPAFERQTNQIYRVTPGNKIYPSDLPEVKEYMHWRISRNKKKLQRLEKCALILQRAFRAFLARTLTARMRQKRAALFIQRSWRGKMCRRKFDERKKEDWAIRLVQRNWRGRNGRRIYLIHHQRRAATIQIQRICRGYLARVRVQYLLQLRFDSAIKIQSAFRTRKANLIVFGKRQEKNGSITIQRVYRGYIGRKRARRERDRFLFSKSQSQGIEFGRQMLVEHKLHGTRLQSEVVLLSKEKLEAESQVENLLAEISNFEEGVRILEREMHELSKVESEATGILDENARFQLREQKMRLDREFGAMSVKIADRKERLEVLESKLEELDRQRQIKEEELRDLEKKLVILLEEQQRELDQIKAKQDSRTQTLVDIASGKKEGRGLLHNLNNEVVNNGNTSEKNATAAIVTDKQRKEANALVESTETMMKFGFMSMSMTYFSSMNMIQAMRKVGVHQTLLDSAASIAERTPQNTTKLNAYEPKLRPGQLPGQQPFKVSGWSIDDVMRWLDTLALGQYKSAFCDAAVDGQFLYDLEDDDLKNTLRIDHALHRKKILNSINRLRIADEDKIQNMTISTENSTVASLQNENKPQSLASSEVTSNNIGSNINNTAPRGENEVDAQRPETILRYSELAAMVRHGKGKTLRNALENLPSQIFDKSSVAIQYEQGVGTVYDIATNQLTFHINQTDDKGNTLLSLAAQNDAKKIADLLIKKGANPDHQNVQGQTPAHYAMAYDYFDLGAWLLDPDKGGARDDLLNMYDLGPYDGLS